MVILLYIDFSKVFDYTHRGEMEQIMSAYDLLKETVTAVMMLYKNVKAMVHSPNRDTDLFNVVSGILQIDTLAPYMFIISFDYGLWTLIDRIKENCFTLKKTRSRVIKNFVVTLSSADVLIESYVKFDK